MAAAADESILDALDELVDAFGGVLGEGDAALDAPQDSSLDPDVSDESLEQLLDSMASQAMQSSDSLIQQHLSSSGMHVYRPPPGSRDMGRSKMSSTTSIPEVPRTPSTTSVEKLADSNHSELEIPPRAHSPGTVCVDGFPTENQGSSSTLPLAGTGKIQAVEDEEDLMSMLEDMGETPVSAASPSVPPRSDRDPQSDADADAAATALLETMLSAPENSSPRAPSAPKEMSDLDVEGMLDDMVQPSLHSSQPSMPVLRPLAPAVFATFPQPSLTPRDTATSSSAAGADPYDHDFFDLIGNLSTDEISTQTDDSNRGGHEDDAVRFTPLMMSSEKKDADFKEFASAFMQRVQPPAVRKKKLVRVRRKEMAGLDLVADFAMDLGIGNVIDDEDLYEWVEVDEETDDADAQSTGAKASLAAAQLASATFDDALLAFDEDVNELVEKVEERRDGRGSDDEGGEMDDGKSGSMDHSRLSTRFVNTIKKTRDSVMFRGTAASSAAPRKSMTDFFNHDKDHVATSSVVPFIPKRESDKPRSRKLNDAELDRLLDEIDPLVKHDRPGAATKSLKHSTSNLPARAKVTENLDQHSEEMNPDELVALLSNLDSTTEKEKKKQEEEPKTQRNDQDRIQVEDDLPNFDEILGEMDTAGDLPVEEVKSRGDAGTKEDSELPEEVDDLLSALEEESKPMVPSETSRADSMAAQERKAAEEARLREQNARFEARMEEIARTLESLWDGEAAHPELLLPMVQAVFQEAQGLCKQADTDEEQQSEIVQCCKRVGERIRPVQEGAASLGQATADSFDIFANGMKKSRQYLYSELCGLCFAMYRFGDTEAFEPRTLAPIRKKVEEESSSTTPSSSSSSSADHASAGVPDTSAEWHPVRDRLMLVMRDFYDTGATAVGQKPWIPDRSMGQYCQDVTDGIKELIAYINGPEEALSLTSFEALGIKLMQLLVPVARLIQLEIRRAGIGSSPYAAFAEIRPKTQQLLNSLCSLLAPISERSRAPQHPSVLARFEAARTTLINSLVQLLLLLKQLLSI